LKPFPRPRVNRRRWSEKWITIVNIQCDISSIMGGSSTNHCHKWT
jgi:hypothetical protein